MLISEAFASFKAKQNNVQWSVSAINENGELVVSLWDQFFEKRSKDTITYVDRTSRWSGKQSGQYISPEVRLDGRNYGLGWGQF